MSLSEETKRITIISMIANQRAKTNIGGSYTIYLEEGRWFLKDEDSFFAAREMSFIDMWKLLRSENEYNLTRYGTAMRNDKRWETLFKKAEFDNVDQWDETGDLMREVNETHERLTKELEQIK